MRSAIAVALGLVACDAGRKPAVGLPAFPHAREGMRRAFGGGAEGHAVASLPDGGAIAALSFFSATDLGQGAIQPVRDGRNGLVVRLRPDGTVMWRTIANVWPKHVAVGPKGEVAIVGQEGVLVLGIEDGAVQSLTHLDGYANDATYQADGQLFVSIDPMISASAPPDAHARIVSLGRHGPSPFYESTHRSAAGVRAGPDGIVEATWEDSAGTFLTRIGPDGRVLWETRLAGTSTGRARLAVTPDGHTLVIAGSPSRVLGVDAAGRIEWTRVFRFDRPASSGVPTAIDAWMLLEDIDVREEAIVVGGMFLGDLTLGGETIHSHDTHVDPIVIGLDRRGEPTWYVRSAGEDVDSVEGVAWTDRRNAWVVGTFLHSIAFGALTPDTSDGTDHGYWAKLAAP